MDDKIVTTLIILGFRMIKGTSIFKKRQFIYRNHQERDARYYVWVTSEISNQVHIEMQKEPLESGIEGNERHTVFLGQLRGISIIEDLNLLLKITGARYYIDHGPNDY